MEETKTNVYQALLEAQGEFKTLKKTETADTGKFSYKYVDLEAVLSMALPILRAHGLLMTQTTDIMGDMPVVVTTITHAESGDAIFGSYPLVSIDRNDPQKLGASLSYARRYALMALLGIATEDDDAQSASRDSKFVPVKISSSQGSNVSFYEANPAKAPTAPQTARQQSFDQPTCPVCGGEMWDNRDKKTNPKAPDFRCKDKNCDGVIWPPKHEHPKEDIEPETSYDAYGEGAPF